MTILVIGGSGFLGRHLCKSLLEDDHQVVVKTRNIEKTRRIFSALKCSPIIIDEFDNLEPYLSCLDNVISLAGASIIDKRWTPSRKQDLIDSRTLPLLEIKEWLTNNNIAISKLLVGSAIGYYGYSKDPNHEFIENSEPFDDFAHQVCEQVETTANKLDRLCDHTVNLRTGVVLGKGGAFNKMALPAKLHLNGKIGNGQQWVSWIHMHDWVNAVKYILSLDTPRKRYNLTSPQPSTNSELSHAIGSSLNKTFQIPIPVLSLKLLLGEASILLTGSQKVLPSNLQAANFEFTYPELQAAVSSLL
ncbi:MAG: TIGR01777 family oxidoreductase [Arenicella sp.]